MGLYTNPSIYNKYTSSNYTDVEPFKGEHFNYHELGIIAATESAANRDAFMKAIALNELASVEQYGTEEVFYESIDFGGLFEKVKAFFKKLIEKIHKIIHTFIAKLSSWFQSSKDFAKKYEKEIIKKWGLVKNDWEFKGFKFTMSSHNTVLTSDEMDDQINSLKTFNNPKLEQLISGKTEADLTNALKDIAKELSVANLNSNASGDNKAAEEMSKKLSAARDKMDEWKDQVRFCIVNALSTTKKSGTGSLDANEFTEELYKCLRNGEDTKEDIKLSDLGSATEVITFIKEYDKIKDQIEKMEKTYTSSVDKLINAISKAQDDIIKENREKKLKKPEAIVQITSFYQTCMGFKKECQIQAYSAELQALKDKCSQYKEVCVKVIGSSKKMTEESVDYSNYYGDSGNFNSFIENVKLV